MNFNCEIRSYTVISFWIIEVYQFGSMDINNGAGAVPQDVISKAGLVDACQQVSHRKTSSSTTEKVLTTVPESRMTMS